MDMKIGHNEVLANLKLLKDGPSASNYSFIDKSVL